MRGQKVVMKSLKINNESGAVLVEAALIAPIIILLLFFGVDMFLYSQGKTVVTQVSRESTIYLATVPGTLVNTNPYVNLVAQEDSNTWSQLCDANYNVDDCPHLNTQYRIYRMLESAKSTLRFESANISTQYSTTVEGNFVTVSISVPVKTFFGMFSGNVGNTVKLRRVNV